MCRAMAAGAQNPEELPEKQLRKQLAATVRSIQWSYAIFWSTSGRQQGYGKDSSSNFLFFSFFWWLNMLFFQFLSSSLSFTAWLQRSNLRYIKISIGISQAFMQRFMDRKWCHHFSYAYQCFSFLWCEEQLVLRRYW